MSKAVQFKQDVAPYCKGDVVVLTDEEKEDVKARAARMGIEGDVYGSVEKAEDAPDAGVNFDPNHAPHTEGVRTIGTQDGADQSNLTGTLSEEAAKVEAEAAAREEAEAQVTGDEAQQEAVDTKQESIEAAQDGEGDAKTKSKK